jgi:hypothetical protein
VLVGKSYWLVDGGYWLVRRGCQYFGAFLEKCDL